MKKICTVVGARPQFIKLAVVSRVLRKSFHEVIIHTGQHYDYNMSDVFFEEMDIPKPDYNLGISGGSHGQMTGQMLAKIEEVLLIEQPDMLIVFGDTNSTMAAALAAVKLHIPVCHIEAGARSGRMDSPEEINRLVTDRVSTLHLASTPSGLKFLAREGYSDSVHLVGDPMYDAFCYYTKHLQGNELSCLTDLCGNHVELLDPFYYLTSHREENTDTDAKLSKILDAMDSLECPTVFPVHPRNQERVIRLRKQKQYEHIFFVQPVGYLTSIALVNHAKKVVTDSGGLQREAFFAKKKCVTLLEHGAWPETLVDGCNCESSIETNDILRNLQIPAVFDASYQPFGDGNSADKIVDIIEEYLNG